jgi:uncharacterized protein
MIIRELGKSGIKVGEIGLGTEHLKSANPKTVKTIVDTAVEAGINYFDVIFNLPGYLTSFGEAFKPYRSRLVLASHIGSSERNGQYYKSRNVVECEKTFNQTLKALGTDYIDVANVHYVKDMKEYREVLKPNGVVDFAEQLKHKGKARLLGISTHDTQVVIDASESGRFDVVTFHVNFANNALPKRNESLAACAKNSVGVVAMKPFAGGTLLMNNSTVRISAIRKGGGKTVKLAIPQNMTPIRCLSYTLAQIGVSTALPGVSNLNELKQILTYREASAEEKDYSHILEGFKEYVDGQCIYCNHCLPCPAGIDVGKTTRLLDTASHGVNTATQQEYMQLKTMASECTGCNSCTKRCPFNVDVVANMKKAKALFEK